MVEYRTHIRRLEQLMNVHFVEVFPEIIEKMGGKMKMRLLCTINEQLTFQCGLVALGNGSAYITINNQRMKKMKLRQGDEVQVKLEKDESKYGMEVPEELEELLKQDAEGLRRFELLPPGKQRYIIHYVSGVKNSQKRIDRAILLIENLKRLPEGKEEFREMLGLEKRVV
ncbi:MAG: YdeI/OmpD-associated family protein [Hymenobacteraceae bacterium]|nr:YdeI/OmpD-associated family protein [Hymenobacteraceae bacterium]MDX5397665.1 YdeI/OmpD-associated family protein [Hymenobacteraceae bacterium]MDX5443095.1 YdeI/OmpD-associated family protein [Hymenobacteraceae bacterium]MDX5513741.1 YdeI/OmpD-associated family protein [Hymenobacteraceae bacterium]